MLTILKKFFRKYKIVHFSNGMWACFIRRGPFLQWEAMSRISRCTSWRDLPSILEYCLVSTEDEANKLHARWTEPSIYDEIRNEL